MALDVGAPPSMDSGTGGIRRVVRGFGVLAASQVVSQAIGFVALVYVARTVGAANLGAYTFAFLLATYFNLFASVGIDYLAMRDIAQDRASLGSAVGETLALQGLLSLALYVLLLVAGSVVTDREVQRIVPIVGLTLITTTLTLDWALLALGRSRSVALWRVIGQVLYASLIPVLVINGESGIVHYAWLNILGWGVTAAGLMWVLLRVSPARFQVNGLRALVRRLRRSIAFGYSLIMIRIYTGVSTLMLGYLESTHAVGIYAAASRLPLALIGFAGIWLTVLFPYTAQRLVANPRGFVDDLGRIITAAIIIGLATAVGAILCAGTLMTTMFGAAYQAASGPFALLSVAAALVLVQANFSTVLLAAGSQRYYAVVMTIAAATIVLLSAILIPSFSATGAALSTVVGECFLTTLTLVGVRRRLGRIPIDRGRLFRGGIAVAIMGIAMFAARSLGGAAIQIGVGLAAALAAARLLDVFEFDALKRHQPSVSEGR